MDIIELVATFAQQVPWWAWILGAYLTIVTVAWNMSRP